MKFVKRQLLLLKDLIDDMLKKVDDRSFWKDSAKPERVKEAKAIQKASEALVELVKRAEIEALP